MTIARVQYSQANAAGALFPCNVTLTVTSGNLLVCGTHIVSAARTPVLSGGGLTYNVASDDIAANNNEHMRLYATVAGSSGSLTINLTSDTGDNCDRALEVWEFSGQHATYIDNASGAAAASAATMSLSTTVDSCLIVALEQSTGGYVTAGSGYTLEGQFATPSAWYNNSEYKVNAGGAGSKTVNFSVSGTQCLVAAAFRPAAGAATAYASGYFQAMMQQ